MLNVLTVDVEEHFHVAAFYSSVSPESWGEQPSRVDRNVNLVLEILDSHGVKATFFVLGWLAERRPDLVRRIASAGHEIGCHTFAHQMVYSQTPEQFRADLRRARQVLMDEFRRRSPAFAPPTSQSCTAHHGRSISSPKRDS